MIVDEGQNRSPGKLVGRPYRWGDTRALVLVAIIMGFTVLVGLMAHIPRLFRSGPCCGEAYENIDKIRAGARQYFVTDHWDSNGNLLPKAFPHHIPLTPPTGPNCDKKLTPTEVWDAAGWGPIHFAVTEPHYYAYKFWGSGTGTASVYTAQALGDLDCDKVWSTHEIRGSIDNEGSVKVVGPIISNEWE